MNEPEDVLNKQASRTVKVIGALVGFAALVLGSYALATGAIDARADARAAQIVAPLVSRAAEIGSTVQDHEARLRALEQLAAEIRADTRWTRAELERRASRR